MGAHTAAVVPRQPRTVRDTHKHTHTHTHTHTQHTNARPALLAHSHAQCRPFPWCFFNIHTRTRTHARRLPLRSPPSSSSPSPVPLRLALVQCHLKDRWAETSEASRWKKPSPRMVLFGGESRGKRGGIWGEVAGARRPPSSAKWYENLHRV